ncbi:hypothetical protein B566_EDAN015568 [Ephemera danica]|nr:hypothetical protein B566_EDAN015568 [Ephemera danica]
MNPRGPLLAPPFTPALGDAARLISFFSSELGCCMHLTVIFFSTFVWTTTTPPSSSPVHHLQQQHPAGHCNSQSHLVRTRTHFSVPSQVLHTDCVMAGRDAAARVEVTVATPR